MRTRFKLSLVGCHFRPSQPFANLVIFFLSHIGRVGGAVDWNDKNERGKIHAENWERHWAKDEL